MKTKKVPEWNADLAARVRDGMTLEALEAEIVSAIEGDSKNNRENARNDALAQALLDTTSINILPESLVEETTQMRFQTMLVDFKEQGSTQEQLEEMCVASLGCPLHLLAVLISPCDEWSLLPPLHHAANVPYSLIFTLPCPRGSPGRRRRSTSSTRRSRSPTCTRSSSWAWPSGTSPRRKRSASAPPR